MTTPILRIVIPDQPFRELGLMLGKALVVKVEPGAVYTIIDDDAKDAIEDVALKEVDDNLVIEFDGEAIVQVDGFFAPVAEGEEASYVYTGLTDASGAPQLVSGGDALVAASDVSWEVVADADLAMASDAGAEPGTLADMPAWAWVGLGFAGVAGAVTLGVAMNSSSDDSPEIAAIPVDPTIVIFDFTTGNDTVDGVAQLGAGVFAAGIEYDIRIYVRDATRLMTKTNISQWAGGANLGDGDTITVTNNADLKTAMKGMSGNIGVTGNFHDPGLTAVYGWTGVKWAWRAQQVGWFSRFTGTTTTGSNRSVFDLWTGIAVFDNSAAATTGVSFL